MVLGADRSSMEFSSKSDLHLRQFAMSGIVDGPRPPSLCNRDDQVRGVRHLPIRVARHAVNELHRGLIAVLRLIRIDVVEFKAPRVFRPGENTLIAEAETVAQILILGIHDDLFDLERRENGRFGANGSRMMTCCWSVVTHGFSRSWPSAPRKISLHSKLVSCGSRMKIFQSCEPLSLFNRNVCCSWRWFAGSA